MGLRGRDGHGRVVVSLSEYLTNLEDEGVMLETDEVFEEEMLEGDSEEDDIEGEGSKERLSCGRNELASDLSSMFDDEAGLYQRDYFEGGYRGEVCHCRHGIACRWKSSFTRNSLSGDIAEDTELPFLGLTWVETWRLQSHRFSEEGLRLRCEGGQGSNDLWDYPEDLCRLEDVQVRRVCENDSLFLFGSRTSAANAGICLVEFAEDKVFQVVVFKCVLYYVAAVAGTTDTIRWNGSEYCLYSRVAEWKFVYEATLQTKTAVDQWCYEHVKDESPDEIERILQDVVSPSGRGLLRYI